MLDLTPGSTYLVVFVIKGKSRLVETIFTGKYISINGTDVYVLENASTNRPYGFTKAELDTFAPMNSEAASQTCDKLTVG